MDVIILLGVNVLLLVLLFVAFALIRGSSKARRNDKPEQRARSRATAVSRKKLDQSGATLSDAATSSLVVNVNGSTTGGLLEGIVPENGVPAGGAPQSNGSNGVTSNGAVSNGVTSNGAVSNGVTSNGVASNGAVSNGSQPIIVLSNAGMSTNGSNGGDPNGALPDAIPGAALPNGAAIPNGGASSETTPNGSVAAPNGTKPAAPLAVFNLGADRGSGGYSNSGLAGDPELFAIDRPAADQPASSIHLDAYLEGNRPARDALVAKIIDLLAPLGLTAERITPSRSRLRSSDGRTVAVTARALTADEDRIEIVLDTSLAGQVFTVLRQWHLTELDATDQLRLSARIR